MSHVLLWQPSECVYLIVNCVISFSENKYDDDDDDSIICILALLGSYLAAAPLSPHRYSLDLATSASATASLVIAVSPLIALTVPLVWLHYVF